VLAQVAERLADEGVSVARLTQHLVDGTAALDVVTHAAPTGRLEASLAAIATLPDVLAAPRALRLVTERGV
jgi:hypothetical protein